MYLSNFFAHKMNVSI